MKSTLLFAALILSFTSFTFDKTIVGEWEYIHDYERFENEDAGHTEKFQRVVVEILNQSICTAFTETYLNEREISGSKEDCSILDGKLKVIKIDTNEVIASGELKSKGNKLVIMEVIKSSKTIKNFKRI